PQIEGVLNQHEVTSRPSDYVLKVLALVKERMTFVEDFWEQASFFFTIPDIYDVDAVKPKWNENKTASFQNIAADFETMQEWTAISLEPFFKNKVADSGMKIGELMMPFRIMLVGRKFGPDVFQIAERLGKDEVIKRIEKALPHLA